MNRWFDKIPILGERFSGKIILSFLMLLLSGFLFVAIKSSDKIICVLGMVFAFMGDIFLNYPPNDLKDEFDILLGGSAFAMAHLIYCISYAIKITRNGFSYFNFGVVFAIILLLAITVYFIYKTKNTSKKKRLYMAIAYLWITGINYITIFSYSFSAKSIESLAMLGGILFLASDVIIGLEKLNNLKSKLARELVWWLYPIGQMLIIIMA